MESKTALPQVMAPPQSQPVILRPLPVSNVKANYKSKSSKIISILQIVGGILILLFSLAATLPVMDRARYMGMQLNCGSGFDMIFLIICGGIGIGASKKKTNCLIISHMVLCILASISIFGHMLQTMGLVIWAVNDMDYDYYGPDYIEPPRDYYDYPRDYVMENPEEGKMTPDGDYSDIGSSPMPLDEDYLIVEPTPVTCYFGNFSDSTRHKISIGMGGVLIVLCLVEFIVSVWGSALACKVTCCCGSRDSHVTPGFQYGQIDPANPHVVVINGQGYQGYPIATGPAVTPAVGAPLSKEQEAMGTQVGSGQPVAPQTPPPPY